MVQEGDTVTYNYDGSDTPYEVDVSNISGMTITTINGAGGGGATYPGGDGGYAESIPVDLDGISTVKIWVAEGGVQQDNNAPPGWGRYDGGGGGNGLGSGAGSTEITIDGTLVAGAGGGGAYYGGGGARGGSPASLGNSAEGSGDPVGGDSTTSGGKPGEGYVNTNLRRVYGGTTQKGGGNAGGGDYGDDADVTIKYSIPTPSAPTNLTLNQTTP